MLAASILIHMHDSFQILYWIKKHTPGSYFPSTQIIKNHNFSQKMIFVSLLGLLAGAAIGALVTCACTDPAGSH